MKAMNRKPTHPGAILKMDVLPALSDEGVSKTQFANDLGISRNQLYGILDEKKSITPNIAVRLGKVLGNGPGIWLRLQDAHDIWVAEHELSAQLKKMPEYKIAL